MLSRWEGEQGYKQIWGKWGEAAEWTNMHQIVSMSLGVFSRTTSPTTNWISRISFEIFSKKTQALKSIFNFLSGFSPLCLATQLFRYSDAERRMHLGSRQFHYTESSCFSSASRPLCRSPSTENWKHGTNNIMCYSNFAPGLVICPSAVTSVADRADVPASLPVFPRLLTLKLSRLHDRSAIVTLSANYFCDEKNRLFQRQGLVTSALYQHFI